MSMKVYDGDALVVREKRPTREYFYPEIRAGGFPHVSSDVDFYTRVNALIQPEFVVRDFGAGRGSANEISSAYVRRLLNLRGKVSKVIGCDVSPAVQQNPLLDEAVLINPTGSLPLADEAFDMIISDWTLEHITNVSLATTELKRILKPGGWICARTPNRWGYIALSARIIPERFHNIILRWVQPNRQQIDIFPTHYLLNTRSKLSKYFSREDFDNHTYLVNGEPAYFGSSMILWWLAVSAFRLVPDNVKAILHVFLQKRKSI